MVIIVTIASLDRPARIAGMFLMCNALIVFSAGVNSSNDSLATVYYSNVDKPRNNTMENLENVTIPYIYDTFLGANVTDIIPGIPMTCDYAKNCLECYREKAAAMERPFCPMQFDGAICWPPSLPDTRVDVKCPRLVGLVWEKSAHRYCGANGFWKDKNMGYSGKPFGHYRECYSDQAWDVYSKYMANKTREEREFIKNIVISFRKMELAGLCLSFVTTVISLFIFWYFSSLKCHRTRIHKNLFFALSVQISMRIILYVDQFVAREMGGDVAGAASGATDTIYDTPIFCEVLYSLLEYTKTVKFMWMFIEGLYLHNMIAISVFSGKPNYVFYYTFAWGVPLLLTIAWAIPMAIKFDMHCWFGYYLIPLIWIMEGPRTAVMVVNLMFLLNIIRVLVMKLRDPNTNEVNRVRKAVKAAIVLLPLLGLTNFVIMLEPDGRDTNKFVVYSFSSSFLIMFEGLFISLLYCFLNGEVQAALRRLFVRHTTFARDISEAAWRTMTLKVRQTLRRQWDRYHQHRLIHSSSLRKMSRSFSIFTSFTEVPQSSASNANGKKNNGTTMGGRSSINGVTNPPPTYSSIFKKKNERKKSYQETLSLGPVSGFEPPIQPFDPTPSPDYKSDIMLELEDDM